MNTLSITISINDIPADVENCHSEVTVSTWKEALIRLYTLANKSRPEYGIAWSDDAREPLDNRHMRSATVPANIKSDVDALIDKENQEDIEVIVVEALNDVYDQLRKHGNNPAFVDLLTKYAREWALECFQ